MTEDAMAQDAERALAGREAVLRVVRSFAGRSSPQQVMTELLDAALSAVQADEATVFRWDDEHDRLVTVRTTLAEGDQVEWINLGIGASGTAFDRMAPVVINDYQSSPLRHPRMAARGVQSAVAIPLMYESRRMGAFTVARTSDVPFTPDDTEILELLAGITSATLVGMEHARLEGVLLAIRTMQHEMNNRLALTAGYAELISIDPDLPEHLREHALEARRGAVEASAIFNQFQGVTHLQEAYWGADGGSTIDLERSGEPDPA